MKTTITTTIAALFACCTMAFALNVLDNGAIRVEISGDGVIGSFLYYPYNNTLDHISDYGLRVRTSGVVRETVEYTQSKKNYAGLNLFTGYGREFSSNLYVCSASYLTGNASYLDQTLVVLARRSINDVSFAQYIDSSVLQTEADDVGEYTPANKLLIFREGSEACYIGTVSQSIANQETFSFAIGPPDYVLSILGTTTANIISNDPANIAGASWWNPIAVSEQQQVFYNRLIGASSVNEMQPLANIPDEATRKVKTPGTVVFQKAKFSQRFSSGTKDSFFAKGYIDMAPYATLFTSLNSLNVSLFIADFLAYVPTDVAGVKIAGKGSKLINKKTDAVLGKEKLKLVLKKNNRLYFTFKTTKSNVSSATGITASSPVAKNGPMLQPFAFILTGTSQTDTKGGYCWIAGRNIPMTYSKTAEKKAKGKLTK